MTALRTKLTHIELLTNFTLYHKTQQLRVIISPVYFFFTFNFPLKMESEDEGCVEYIEKESKLKFLSNVAHRNSDKGKFSDILQLVCFDRDMLQLKIRRV